MIARQTLHLSLKGEGSNVADAKTPETWNSKWPQLCAWFGVRSAPPPSDDSGGLREVRKYVNEHIDVWKCMEEKYGLKKGVADSDLTFQGFEYFLLTQSDFDRQYDMTKMYATGFEEERDVMGA